MNDLFVAAVMGFLILLASMISVEVGISVALIEIFLTSDKVADHSKSSVLIVK
ncbi:MAG: hypothetical protein IBX64_08940 [Actinobacteria bacterium]|nr:hypothetical protein [Actinomycetota bacterium]